MSHSPEELIKYVCDNCQVMHAGTPIHRDTGDHDFEPPETCGCCGESSFTTTNDWIRKHD